MPTRTPAPQVMDVHHNFLHRQVILVRACSEDVTPEDEARLERYGIRWGALLGAQGPWRLRVQGLTGEWSLARAIGGRGAARAIRDKARARLKLLRARVGCECYIRAGRVAR